MWTFQVLATSKLLGGLAFQGVVGVDLVVVQPPVLMDLHGEAMNSILRKWCSSIVTWIVLASLWTADLLIQVILTIRPNERRIRPTERTAWPKGLKQQLMTRQDNTCVYCGYRRTAPCFDIDHMTPVVRGGQCHKQSPSYLSTMQPAQGIAD